MISSKKAMTNPTRNNLVLGEISIPYLVTKKRKRHLSFRFSETTLMVSAPLRMTTSEIEAGLRTKQEWILTHYAKKQTEALPKDHLRLLGNVVRVEYALGATHQVELVENTLMITHQSSQTEKAALSQSLMKLADLKIKPLFQDACRQSGIAPQTIELKNLKASLGRCSSKRHITLAYRLIHYPPEVISAVCYHELAHLIHMNHSQRFYAQLEAWMPTYRHVMKNARNFPSVSAID